MNKIHFENVVFQYAKNEPIIQNINIKIHKNGLNLLIGKNGAGKTTFMKLILNLLKTTKGNVHNNFKKISFIGSTNKVPNNITVIKYLSRMHSINNVNNEEKIKKALGIMKIKDLENKLLTDLSSGQSKRVSISLSIINDSNLIIMDEPFANLDNKSCTIISKYIKETKGHKLFIVSSHNFEYIDNITDNVISLDSGKISFFGKRKEYMEKYKSNNIMNIYKKNF